MLPTIIAIGRYLFLIALIVLIVIFRKRQKQGKPAAAVRNVIIGLIVIQFSISLIADGREAAVYPTIQQAGQQVLDREVTASIAGSNTAMVIACDESKNMKAGFVYEEKNGWRQYMGTYAKVYNNQFVGDPVMASVYLPGKSNDVYAVFLWSGPEEALVSDSLNSVFYYTIMQTGTGEPFYLYYAVLSGFDESYRLTVNQYELTNFSRRTI